nr:Chain A, Fusion glycoprotein F0 [Mojiang virus]8FMY_B Chain B, Fusion glycoprotein F0 [Mojiang virus]8FMY_C Chain C, Fusion glycoprotein F0 [Mojiang virus]
MALNKNMFSSLFLGYLLVYATTVQSSIHYDSLSKVGVIKGLTYNYKIKGSPSTKLMVVKLIPNIDSVKNCTQKQYDEYKNLVRKALEPVKMAIDTMLNNVKSGNNKYRFAGAIMAGVALGVATAATVTAGIALHRSNENAQAIANMKSAIQNTNEAVKQLQLANKQTLAVIDTIRGEINNNIIPVINQLSCDTIGLSVGIRLTQYYSEIITAFGPALQNPVNTRITIQAISSVFNGNFDELLKIMGYTSGDLYEILHSELIRGNIIDVDVDAGYIALEIEFPNLTLVPNAVVQELMPISYNIDGDEWVTLVPRFVLTRTTLLSNIDTSRCTITDSSVICDNDYALPMSHELIGCLQGDTSKCAREKVVSSYVPKFALSDGLVYANCLNTICRCMDTDTPISQSLGATVSLLDNKRCSVYQVGDVLISVGSYLGDGEYNADNVELGPPIVIDKIDIGNQLAGINQTLQEAEDYIEKSEEFLKG